MIKQCVWGCVVVLAGCGAHSLSGGLGMTAGSPGASASGASATGSSDSRQTSAVRCDDPQSLDYKSKTRPCIIPAEAAAPAPVYLPDGRLDKREESGKLWTVLEGFTPAEATQRAKAAGYRQRIEVDQLARHDPACKRDTVCRAEPFRWELDAGEDGAGHLTLLVNPTVSITKPD